MRTSVVGLVVVGTLSFGVAAHASNSQPADTTCTDCTILAPAGDDVTADRSKARKAKKPKDKLLL